MLIEAHPYSIETIDLEKSVEIRLWCLDRNSETILCRVKDFCYICKIEIPDIQNVNEDVAREIMKLIGKKVHIPITYKLIWNRKLYGYSTKKYPFIEVKLKCLKDLNILQKYIRENEIEYEEDIIKLIVHEANSITIFNKMLSIQNISTTDCFTVEGEEVDEEDKISSVKQEYIVKSKTFKLNENPWMSKPLEMSFDIETYSKNHRRFPNAERAEDIIYSFSCCFFRGSTNIKNYFLVIDECDEIENTTIVSCINERVLIVKFFDLLREYHPNVISGHNIFGFDIPYIYKRIKTLDIKIDNFTYITRKNFVKKIEWKSSAYGKQELMYFDIPETIFIDTLSYIRRDYKLKTFSLNSVSKYFLNETKEDLNIQQMFKLIEENLTKKNIEKIRKNNAEIGKYNVQDSLLVMKLVNVLKIWITIIKQAAIVRINPIEFMTRGQTIRCQAQLYHIASHNEVTLTTREKTHIFSEGGKVENPIVGYWPVLPCFDFNSLYPSIIIAYNIDFTTLVKSEKEMEEIGYNNLNIFEIEQEEPIDFDLKDDFEESDSNEEDDFEEHPKKKKKDTTKVKRKYKFAFIKKEIYEGLGPMIEKNLLEERKRVKKEMKLYEDEIARLIKEEGSHNKIEELSVKASISDAIQKGIKICANSYYGFYGAQKFNKYSLIEGSMAVTAKGRELITIAAKYFEEKFSTVTVYGDTDSVMAMPPIKFDKTSPEIVKTIYKKAKEMEESINKSNIFPSPLYIEFEKMMCAVLLKKKHYFYRTWNSDGTPTVNKYKQITLTAKGVVIARRDRSKLLEDVYTEVANNILDGKTFIETFGTICLHISDILELKEGVMDKIIIVKTMGDKYKNKTYPLSILKDEMNRINRPINAGEKFSCVIVNDYRGNEKIGYKIRPLELINEIYREYGIKLGNDITKIKKKLDTFYPPEEIDTVYYVRSFIDVLDTLLESIYSDEINKFINLTYIPPSPKRSIKFEHPMKFIEKILKTVDRRSSSLYISSLPYILLNFEKN